MSFSADYIPEDVLEIILHNAIKSQEIAGNCYFFKEVVLVCKTWSYVAPRCVHELDISETGVSDLRTLPGLTALKSLNVYRNRVVQRNT